MATVKVKVPQKLDPVVIYQPDGTSQAYAIAGGYTQVDEKDLATFLWAIPEASTSAADAPVVQPLSDALPTA